MPATRVLVVEDERIVAMHLRQQLQKLAYEVPAVAHSGRQALRSIEEDKPDIVLMDIHIDGEMDGIETAAKIPADLGIPVIYLTAYSDDGTLARARNTGPSGYLVKPFSERELHATIQMAMERRRTDAAAREHGRELEELVIARTASLSSALRQLEAETAEREAAEAALRQAQKMEAVGHLTGGIAHDFNNLLTVVSGSLELIRDNPADTARVLRLARSAIGAAERGAALISQLLMFSGRKAVRPEPVGLNEMIADLQVLMGHASGAGCQIVIRMQHLLDPVLVDVAELQAAILNLVINAGEAIRGQGRIAIETDSVVVGPGIRRSGRSHHATSCQDLMPGRYVVLTVSDNGDGIAPDLLPRVFEPFFTTKEVGKGSGLRRAGHDIQ
jgi:signal transduction histidine kinase